MSGMSGFTNQSPLLRVAAVQATPIAFNKQKTLEKIAKLTAELIVTADIDLKASLDFDAVGHYARPDALQLIVSRTPGQSVIFED